MSNLKQGPETSKCAETASAVTAWPNEENSLTAGTDEEKGWGAKLRRKMADIKVQDRKKVLDSLQSVMRDLTRDEISHGSVRIPLPKLNIPTNHSDVIPICDSKNEWLQLLQGWAEEQTLKFTFEPKPTHCSCFVKPGDPCTCTHAIILSWL